METTAAYTGRAMKRLSAIGYGSFVGCSAGAVAVVAAPLGLIGVPSRIRPTPSVTMTSPGVSPAVTMKFLPSLWGDTVIFCEVATPFSTL